jgi:hypothetical protein
MRSIAFYACFLGACTLLASVPRMFYVTPMPNVSEPIETFAEFRGLPLEDAIVGMGGSPEQCVEHDVIDHYAPPSAP